MQFIKGFNRERAFFRWLTGRMGNDHICNSPTFVLLDRPTCVYILPVTSKKSSIIGGSWCSIVVGTKSGSVIFYNEEGLPLLRQQIFSEAVSGISISVSPALQGYLYATSGNSLPFHLLKYHPKNFGEFFFALKQN